MGKVDVSIKGHPPIFVISPRNQSGEKHLGAHWGVDSLSSAFSGDNSITHGNGFAINIEDVIDAVHRRIV